MALDNNHITRLGELKSLIDGVWTKVKALVANFIDDAPSDGNEYVRKDGQWIKKESGDKLWAHWKNDDGWSYLTNNTSIVPKTGFMLAEGELIDSAMPHLKPGLYNFYLEISFSPDGTETNEIDKIDLSLMYGSNTLRAQSLLVDLSVNEIQNINLGGCFKMTEEGDLNVKLRPFFETVSTKVNVKWSHLFVSKFGDVPEPEPVETVIIDGLEYSTVKIGNQIWMAENCQAVQGDASFYNDDETTYGRNGKNYGKLYNWDEAMALAERVPGWHLPTDGDFSALTTAVGGPDIAGTMLKSKTGWINGSEGTDTYGFSAFPVGYWYVGDSTYEGGYKDEGNCVRFWSSTETSTSIAVVRAFVNDAKMYSGFYNKSNFRYPLRLVKDSE